MPEFLLPFRKPKRIRTAFSPSQLLKLEQAFEKNQYVVGAERKELAKTLNLSETQVRRQLPMLNRVRSLKKLFFIFLKFLNVYFWKSNSEKGLVFWQAL